MEIHPTSFLMVWLLNGRVQLYDSELEAINLALHHAPRHSRLLIISNNQAAITQVQSLIKGRQSLFRSVFASIPREIHISLNSRHAQTDSIHPRTRRICRQHPSRLSGQVGLMAPSQPSLPETGLRKGTKVLPHRPPSGRPRQATHLPIPVSHPKKNHHHILMPHSFSLWSQGSFFSKLNFKCTNGLVVLRGTTKDAERASKACSKHSTHSGHSMIKPVANSAA